MHEMFDRILSLRVGDVMATEPITIALSASMADVAQIFASRGLHSAPVVDQSGMCVGIITASDFVKRSEIGSATENVADCMTQGVQAITPATPLIKAARIMTEAHLHVLPVIEDHRPVGIVSNLDVVAALVNSFDEAKNTI